MRRPDFRSILGYAQDAVFLWQVFVFLGVGSLVGALLNALTQLHIIWQVSSVLALGFLGAALVRTGWDTWKAHQRSRYTDEELANALDDLAQRMIRIIADGMRNAPDPTVTTNRTGGSETAFAAWQRSVAQHSRHENMVLARLMEDTHLELSGLTSELKKREAVSPDDVQSLYWRFRTMHWARDIPLQLGEWANELRR
jgi:hypothetical protein